MPEKKKGQRCRSKRKGRRRGKEKMCRHALVPARQGGYDFISKVKKGKNPSCPREKKNKNIMQTNDQAVIRRQKKKARGKIRLPSTGKGAIEHLRKKKQLNASSSMNPMKKEGIQARTRPRGEKEKEKKEVEKQYSCRVGRSVPLRAPKREGASPQISSERGRKTGKGSRLSVPKKRNFRPLPSAKENIISLLSEEREKLALSRRTRSAHRERKGSLSLWKRR